MIGHSMRLFPAIMKRLTPAILLCFFWFTGWAVGVEITAGPTIQVQGTAATVQWNTDVECGTLFKFGLDADHLNHKAEGKVGLSHSVTLEGLLDGKTYFFSAGTAKRPLQNGQFTVGKPVPVVPAAPASPKGTPASCDPTPPAPPVPRTPAPKPAPSVIPAPSQAPPTRATWGDPSSLADHFARHGRDFGATSADDYARKAWEFLQRAMDEGLPAKVDEDGVIRVYESRTKSFASYNKIGRTKTFFKPQRPDYFRDQPGKPIRLNRPASGPQ